MIPPRFPSEKYLCHLSLYTFNDVALKTRLDQPKGPKGIHLKMYFLFIFLLENVSYSK